MCGWACCGFGDLVSARWGSAVQGFVFRVLGGKVQASGFKGQSLCLGFEAVALRVSARRDLRFGVYVWICMGWGIPSFFFHIRASGGSS